ncbi:MAG: PepSY domain-containing protein, partial [Chloroflexi bacterium]|nr:PepSY domain-containing protein [Chloroflexota bacterium]
MKKLSRGIAALLLVAALTLTSVLDAWAGPPPQDLGPSDLLSHLKQTAQGELDINWDSSTGIPDFILGNIPLDGLAGVSADPDTKARSFIRYYSRLFKLKDSDNEFSLVSNAPDELGMIHLKFQQYYQGVKVYGSQLAVHLKNHTVTAVNGRYTPDISLSVTPEVSSQEAEQAAVKDLAARNASVVPGKTELVVYNAVDGPHLAWTTRLASDNPPGRWVYFVDAHNGSVINKYDTIKSARDRLTYTANYGTALPGSLVVTESGPLPGADAVAINAHNNI